MQIYTMYHCSTMYHPAIKPVDRQASDRIRIEPCADRVLVKFNNRIIANSSHVLCLYETGHKPVLYFPREDVHMRWLQPVSNTTHCPYKGNASYWMLRVGKESVLNIAWSYENPIPAVSAIKDYLAFYDDKIHITQQLAQGGEKP